MGSTFQFSDYVLDSRNFELRRDGRRLKLERIPMELLILLVEREGTLVSRDEITQRIWGKEVFFEADTGINTAVSKLRQALRDDAESPKYIQTVVGKGYRFIASINQLPTPSAGNGQERHEIVEAMPVPTPAPVQGARGIPRPGRWLMLSVAVLLLALTVGYRYYVRAGNSQSLQTVAVLPFQRLNAGAGDEYLELGMADALITKLSRSGRLVVRPTSAIMKYTGADADPLAAGRALHVDTILEGNIQRLDERLRLSLRLIRVRDGVSLWSDSYDTKFTDVFQVQDTVSEEVAEALAVRLSSQEKAEMQKHDTANVQAYDLCMKGVFFWNKRSEEGLRRAIPYFEQAIALDDHYALAHAGLAAALAPVGYLGYRPSDEIRPQMRAAATRAVALDPNLPLAHVALGAVLAFYEWNWSDGEKEFRRALELNPDMPLAHHWYGLLLECTGRYEDALKQRQRAQELDPVTPIIVSAVGQTLFLLGDNDPAVTQFRTALELDNSLDQAHVGLGQVHERRGDYQRAIAEYKLAVQYAPGSMLAKAALGHALARSGAAPEARELLSDLLSASHNRYVSPVHVAMIYAGLGDNEGALSCLEKAYDQSNATLSAIVLQPQLQSLRGDPRFRKLLLTMGLAQPVR